jgi:hypothetical protein
MTTTTPRSHKNRQRAQTPAIALTGVWATFIERHELTVVKVLCLLAGLRVLIFAAALPLYNNVDEGAHFDLICKYSVGHIPRHMEHYSREAAERLALTFSSEYYPLEPGMTESSIPSPAWTESAYHVERILEANVPYMLRITNHESTQPPLYYAIAGLWFRLGKLLTLNGGHLVFWLKLIDVFVYIPFVWVSYLFARRFYGHNEFIRLGVPLLLVVFPQDAMYSLNNDVLTPLLFGLSFYCLMDIYASESKSYTHYLLTGLAVAAAFLTKFSNLPILIVLAAVLVLRLLKLRGTGRLKWELPKLAVLGVFTAGLIAPWLIRNKMVLGDMSGAAAKIQRLGWTAKPFSAIWHHPMFTPGGAIFFWNGLMRTFWRGEIVWFGKAMASAGVDLFYVLSTTVFIGASIAGLWMLRKKLPEDERFVSIMGLVVFAVSVAFIGFLSILYDYGRCFYPSREHPFLISGRLICGTMIPFAALYLWGLDFILSEIGLSAKRWLVLSGIMAVILVSEIAVTAPAFGSLFNWYHMF